MSDPHLTEREVRRLGPDGAEAERDTVAVEEPLEVRVDSEALMMTMRTPGEDRFLAVGFLHAEGIVGSLADVGTVTHCGRPGQEGFENVIDVVSGPGVALDPSRLMGARRGTLTTASCGVCGRRSIDDLLARIGTVDREPRIARELLLTSPRRLSKVQPAFARTGGLHGAAAFDRDGATLAHAEDVGRHNAVDKVIGKLLYRGRVDDAVVLTVSGRVSFEIVQKAAAAKIPALAAVSAPTSLAVDLANRAEMTLAAFVRGGRMNIYAGGHRLG